MREILFRGKRVDNGEWLEGWYQPPVEYKSSFDGTLRRFGTTITYKSKDGWLEDEDVDPATVGQYTGLTDKNGAKIFEGDILKIHNDYTGDAHPFDVVVVFLQGAFVCQYIGEEVYNHFCSWNVPLVWWEIIGNIYDNPELMEGGEGDA